MSKRMESQNDPQETLHLRLLGRPAVRRADSDEWRPLQSHVAGLLAVLALQGRSSRDGLASLFWSTRRDPAGNLRTALYKSSRLTGHALVRNVCEDKLLELHSAVVHDLSWDQCGADAPLPLLEGCRFSADTAAERWLEEARDQCHRAQIKALGQRADALWAKGEAAAALAAAHRLAELAPDDETHCLRLMEFHARLQQWDEASNVCRLHVRALQHQGTPEPALAVKRLALLIDTRQPLQDAMPTWPKSTLQLPSVDLSEYLSPLSSAVEEGRCVLLLGQPGAGKTHLIRCAQAGSGLWVAVQTQFGEQCSPYALLTHALQALLAVSRPDFAPSVRDELARLLPNVASPQTPANQARMVAALRTASAQWLQAGVTALVVDDFQRCDEASLRTLLQLSATAGTLPLVLICRTGEVPEQLCAALASHARRWRSLEVGAMKLAQVTDLLRRLPFTVVQPEAWAACLHAHSLGNALHLRELLQALYQREGPALLAQPPPPAGQLPVPQTLEGLLDAQLRRLPARALYLAQLAAQAGGLFTPRLARVLSGAGDVEVSQVLEFLRERGFLDETGRLGNDSLRSPLLRMVSASLLADRHARIAEHAATEGARAADVAWQWRRAGRWKEAAAAFEQAAQAAMSLNARQDELQMLDIAAECLDHVLDQAGAFALRHRASQTALHVATHALVMSRILALQRSAQGDEQELMARNVMSNHLIHQQAWPEALPSAALGLAMARALSDQRPSGDMPSVHVLAAYQLQASAYAAVGESAKALGLVQQIHAQVERCGDTRLQMDFAGTAGYVHASLNDTRRAASAYEVATALADQLHDGAEAMTFNSSAAANMQRTGDMVKVKRHALAAHTWALRIGDNGSHKAMAARLPLAACLVIGGELREGLAQLHQLNAEVEAAGFDAMQQFVELHMSTAYLMLGDVERARLALRTPLAQLPMARRCLSQRMAMLIQRLDMDDEAGPVPGLQPSHLQFPQAGPESFVARANYDLSLSLALPAGEAVSLCSQIAARAAASGSLALQASAQVYEADAWRRMGEFLRAQRLIQPVLKHLSRCQPLAMSLPFISWTAWQALSLRGPTPQALQALDLGRRWLLDRAHQHVDLPQQHGFLRLNTVHRKLLAAAGAQGLGGAVDDCPGPGFCAFKAAK